MELTDGADVVALREIDGRSIGPEHVRAALDGGRGERSVYPRQKRAHLKVPFHVEEERIFPQARENGQAGAPEGHGIFRARSRGIRL
jgi:hypothetical protein